MVNLGLAIENIVKKAKTYLTSMSGRVSPLLYVT